MRPAGPLIWSKEGRKLDAPAERETQKQGMAPANMASGAEHRSPACAYPDREGWITTTLQMQYFITLARHMNFTRAAEALFVSQPTLSRHIELLEQELGFALIEREKKQISLTHAGEAMLVTLKSALRLIEAGREQGARLARGSQGLLRVGLLDSLDGDALLPNLIAPFRRECPDVRLEFERHSFNALRDRLSWGKLDVLITVDIDCENLAGVATRPVASFPKVLLMSRLHPLAGRLDRSFADFRSDTFFIPGEEDSPGREQALCSVTGRCGFTPACIRTVPNLESAFFSVAAGLGVMIVDKSTKYIRDPHCTYLELDEADAPRAVLVAAYRQDNTNPAAKRFLERLKA